MDHDLQGLRSLLISLDGAGYGQYKRLKHIAWQLGSGMTLFFDRVQADPFAPASNLRLQLDMKTAQIPRALFSNKIRNIAACDFLTRQFHAVCSSRDYDRRVTGPWAAKKGNALPPCVCKTTCNLQAAIC